jgi:hypothetical protein
MKMALFWKILPGRVQYKTSGPGINEVVVGAFKFFTAGAKRRPLKNINCVSIPI